MKSNQLPRVIKYIDRENELIDENNKKQIARKMEQANNIQSLL